MKDTENVPSSNEQKCKKYLQDISVAFSAGDVRLAREIAEEAVEIFPKTVRIRDCLASLLDHQGEFESALSICVRSAEIQLARLAAGSSRATRKLDPNTRVFISGHFYSGSGAVLDYLCDYDGFVSWSPAGEMRLIKFPGGLGDLMTRCSTDGLDAQALVDLYLHIRGKKALTHGPGVYSRWGKVNKHSRKLWKSNAAKGYLKVCLECFLGLYRLWMERSIRPGELREFFKGYLEAAFDAAANDSEADYLLIDQAINAFRLHLAELVPPSTFIVVHRDPRDQFVDAMSVLSAPGRKALSAKEFSVSYRKRRAKATKEMEKMKSYGHRFLDMSFEDFIVNFESSRKIVDGFIGIERDRVRKDNFVPQRSMQNIGKFGNEISGQEAEELAAGNSQFLSEHTERMARSD